MDQLPNQKTSFFRKEAVFLIIVFIAAILLGILVLLRLNLKPEALRGADYTNGLPKEEVSIGVTAEISGLYPTFEFEQESVQANSNIYEGLTISRNGRVVPGLAQSWTNPDTLTWRIKLRDGVKFHSGDSLKASDVKYSIEEAKKNETWVSNFVAVRVDSVKVLDEKTVELKTKNPDPTLLHWMVLLFIISEDQVKQDGLEKAVGTGPYKLVSFNKKAVVLQANANYWAGAPKVKKLTYKQFDDDEALTAALENGQINMAMLTSKNSNKRLKEKGFQVISSRLSDINYIGVNTTKKPFVDVNVRKAVWLALNIPSLLENSNIAGEALSQFATPELIGYNPALPKPKQDLQEAKELLTEAGFPQGFSLTLDVPFPRKDVAEEIKKQLAQVGIKVKLNVMTDQEAFFTKVASGDFSAYTLGYAPDTLDSTDLLQTLLGTNNLQGYSNPDLDKLLDEAAKTFNPKERAEIMGTAHKKAVEDLPIIPLYTRVGFFVISDDIAFNPVPFGFIFGFEISGRQKVTEAQ